MAHDHMWLLLKYVFFYDFCYFFELHCLELYFCIVFYRSKCIPNMGLIAHKVN